MSKENLIISLVLCILFLLFTMPMIFGIAKMVVQMKMKDQLWNVFSTSMDNLSGMATGNHKPNSVGYKQKAYKSNDSVNLINSLLFLMLLVFASLMYLNSDRGSPEQSDVAPKEKVEDNKQMLASLRINVPKGGRIKTKKSTDYLKKEKTSLEKKEKTSIYNVRTDGVIKEEANSLEKTQQFSERLNTAPIKSEAIITEKVPTKKEVFTVQYSANTMRTYAINNKKKLSKKYSDYWIYLYDDPSDRKAKVWIGQFETKEAAIIFGQQFKDNPVIISIAVTSY